MPFTSRLDRYIFRLTIVPLFGVFVLAASLLILDQMLRLFRFVTTEGGPVGGSVHASEAGEAVMVRQLYARARGSSCARDVALGWRHDELARESRRRAGAALA